MRAPVLACVVTIAALLSRAAHAESTPIKHIILVIQENRTPDNLFQGLNRVLPGADIASYGYDKAGHQVTLGVVPLANDYDLGHSHYNFVDEYDGGKMDGWSEINCRPKPGVATNCPTNPALRAVSPSDVVPYFQIATNYGFANRMFQTNQGPSFPAHQFLLSGTSQLSPSSPFFASENMLYQNEAAGCAAPADQRVYAIGPNHQIEQVFPCFEHQTLPDLLDRHVPAIKWRYYTPEAGLIWTAPNSIDHLCQPSSPPRGQQPICDGPAWRNGAIVINSAQILADIFGHDLASVSWVIPRGQDSDHPIENDGSGPDWVSAIVNNVGNSSYWNDTVILITWDDWGGWFDHVPPPPASAFGYYEYGFRVPLLVVSPYTPRGYVSNVQHDFGSILAFIEHTFSLGTIPPHSFADARGTDALSDFFDFSAPPRPFTAIASSRTAQSFLDDTRPALPPDDD
jgi:phospholipase C